MRVTIPVYVRQYRPEGSPGPLFHARPLFAADPHRGGSVLSRVLNKLASDLRKVLDGLGRAAQQRELADWTFNPVLERQALKATLSLRRRTVNAHALAVAFQLGKARLGFFPELPRLWFDVSAGQSLAARAEEVLTEHFMSLEKEEEKFDAEGMLGGNVVGLVLTTVDVEVELRPALPKPPERPMFLLGAAAPADGFHELYKVGRLLDADYPDDLHPAVHRDAEVAELSRRLSGPDRRAVLLLGPRGVGKTAVVHESVRRRLAAATGEADRSRHAIWLISPQRLISGMSYVGQWEDRLLAILKEAGKRDDVLYFNDLVGLYFAGQTSRSSLSAADVLRPVLEHREFRLLAEMTPEAFRVLRERDRAMADLLDVLPIREPDEATTRRILVSVQRQLEDRNDSRFELDALPTVLDLQRRYVRDVAMPGKAAELLRRLAGANPGRPVARADALAAFGAYSGMSTEFIDPSVRVRRADVLAALSRRVVSQPAALEAMADAVCVAKARLNDPSRPVATFLFLGPTGVGKTECAKALAAYLLGAAKASSEPMAAAQAQPARQRKGPGAPNSRSGPSVEVETVDDGPGSPRMSELAQGDGNERLLRFDMNEMGDVGAAGRLIGTFADPEGLLTGAVRRQPFAVVLLDEIEKAHPAVFDLLLAVLGEGRLTDARGRTADFTNCIIVMTSNLGAREAGASFGLRAGGASDADSHQRYRDAAQRFFRPEFYNRIDRVVPFDRLDRQDVADIARRLMDDLLRRDGLTGRRCMMRVDPAAIQRVVDAGYHPQLGARALKREVEKRVAAPVARRLATMPPGAPMLIDVGLTAAKSSQAVGRGNPQAAGGDLTVRVTPLEPARAIDPGRRVLYDPAWAEAGARIELLDGLLDQSEAVLADLERAAEALAPAGGMTQGRMSASQFAYLAIREQVGAVERLVEWLDRAVEAASRPPARNVRKGGRPPQRPTPVRPPVHRVADLAVAWEGMLSSGDVMGLAEPFPADEQAARLWDLAADLLDELALLRAMVEAPGEGSPSEGQPHGRGLLVLRGPWAAGLADGYIQAFERQPGVQVEDVEGASAPRSRRLPSDHRGLLVDLPGGATAFRPEQGLHLDLGSTAGGQFEIVEVQLLPLAEGEDPVQRVLEASRQGAGEAFGRGLARAWGRSGLLDLRTGLALAGGTVPPKAASGPVLRRMILGALPGAGE